MRASLIGLVAALVAAFLCAQVRAGTYFIVQCGYSHTNNDDAIKGDNGTHSHDYFGSTTTSFSSTYQSMTGSTTTCGTSMDTAGYWIPTPVLGNQFVHPLHVRVYYGCGSVACAAINTPRANMMVIGGNSAATAPNQKQERFDCGQNTPVVSYPYNCGAYYAAHPGLTDSSNDGVVAWAVIPQWWDGVSGDTSSQHSGAQPADFSYTKTGAFTKALPLITIRAHLGHAWDACLPLYGQDPAGKPTCLKFGYLPGGLAVPLEYWQFHGDFWNTWNQPALEAEVHNCLTVQPNNCPHFFGTHYPQPVT